ncbi:hypothetical protein GGS20DRAFT_540481 [Poronia punctata]|nr:hypothetical protein GGS20DRAFT_540481 [Poronia punctata]
MANPNSPEEATKLNMPDRPCSMDEIYNWAAHSPYSPLHLQHLRQPVPRDAPRGLERQFTFRDAFEDLLIAGSGLPLPDAREQARIKLLTVNGFPAPLHVTGWVTGLGTMGLWGSLFDLRPEVREAVYWRPSRRMAAKLHPFESGYYFRPRDWIRGLFDSSSSGWLFGEEEEEEEGDYEHDSRGPSSLPSLDPKKIWDEAYKALRDHVFEEEDEHEHDEPEVEEDLFTRNVNVVNNDDDNNKNNHKKGLVVTRPSPSPSSESESETDGTEQVTTTQYPDGTKLVVTTKRRVDDNSSESTTTSRWYDQDDNLIAEAKEVGRSRSWKAGGPNSSASATWSWNHHSEGSDQGDGEQNGGKKKGWFWRK